MSNDRRKLWFKNTSCTTLKWENLLTVNSTPTITTLIYLTQMCENYYQKTFGLGFIQKLFT